MIERIIILIGPPGAGKGYYGTWLIREKGYVKFSSGDIARKYSNSESELGYEIRTLVENGKLIPPKMISEILFREITEINPKIIIDGFPRNIKQAKFFLREYRNRKWKMKPIVLFLNINEKISNNRVLGRLTCSVCGQPYHIELKPPKINGKCDFDNAQLIKRIDETKNKQRWDVYKEETLPLIEKMKQSKKNYDFYEIDCSKKTKVIQQKIEKILS